MIVCMLMALPSAYFHYLLRHQASQQGTALGGSQREQILARSRCLLPILLPESNDVDLELTLNRCYRVSQQETRTWVVDCSGSARGKNAQLVWSADTGELLHASQWNVKAPTLTSAASTTRNQAIALSRDWLHALPVRQDSSASWRIVAAKPARDTQWTVHFQGGDRVAEFDVNAATGQLVWMACSPRSDSKIACNR